MIGIKTIFTKVIALLLCVFEIVPVPINLNAIKSSLSQQSLITNEEIANALRTAEFVNDEDSSFNLHFDDEGCDVDLSEEDDDKQLVFTSSDYNMALLSASSSDIPGDPMVYYTQLWLNQTYGHISDFDQVPENGKTGWPTIYGLIEALQYEMGITSLAKNFGPSTSTAYQNNILSRNDGVTDNKYAILQGALWCKGYNPGYNYSYNSATGTVSINAVFDERVENAIISLKEDAGLINPDGVVTLNVMKALMSMDAFKLLSSYGGDPIVRSMQQKLNRKYEAYIGLMPCDGIYGRNTNKAIIYALQAEEGMPVSVANGNFGNTTKLCCPTIPYVHNNSAARRYPGTASSDYYDSNQISAMTELLKFALYVNGFPFDSINGSFDTDTQSKIVAFQKKFSIPVTGKADLTTWLSLFISCGDKDRTAYGCDCATILTAEKAQTLYNNGYRYVGRYLTGTYNGGISKALTNEEVQIIFDAGLRFFPIYQTSARQEEYFTPSQGISDANSAIDAAASLGIPKGSTIYFAVDFDAIDSQITASVIPYFQKVHEVMSGSVYNTGIYGTRNACSRVSNAGYADFSFVGDMSTGFSGNLGFDMPENWAFDQFATVSIGSGAGSIEIDKDGVSGKDQGVSHVDRKVIAEVTSSSFHAGTADNDDLIGPTVTILGNEVPLFTLDLEFSFPNGFSIESDYNEKDEELYVIIGLDLYDYAEKTTGIREKPTGEKFNQVFREVTTMVSAIGKNDSVFKKKYNDFKGSLYTRGLELGFSTSADCVGYMTFSFESGEPVLKNGEVGIIGRVIGTYEYPIVPAINVKFEIEGRVDTGLKLIRRSSSVIDLGGHMTMSLEPSIAVGANVYIANAYVGANGKLECTVTFPFESFRNSFLAELTANFFFEYEALKYTGKSEWPFYHLQLYPPEENERRLLSAGSIDDSKLELLGKINKTRSVYSDDILENSMQQYSKPQLLALNNQKMLALYIGDDASRTDENSAVLLYRVFDGNQWSSAIPVMDDGTDDFEPIVCSDNNGGAHIVWQNATRTFSSGVTLSEMASAIDLNYIHFNGTSFDGLQVLTSSNSTPEMNHRISSSGSEISVVWVQNSDDSIFGLSGSNSIYHKEFSSGVWNPAELISSNLSVINSLDVSYDDNAPVIAYTAKSGTDFAEISDFELYYYSEGQTNNVTNDNVADLYSFFCGSDLYWNSDGEIKTIQDNDGVPEIVSLTQSSIGIGKFEVLKKSDGSVIAVWESENKNGMSFYRSDFNPVSEVFGLPYEIQKDFGVVRGWNACIKPDDTLQLIYSYADYLQNTDNLEYGTLNLICKSESSICNIAVDSVATFEGTMAPNNEITVKADVYNIGDQVVNQFDVSITGKNNNIISSLAVNQTLSPGDSTELCIPFVLPDSIDDEYHIKVLPSNNTDYSESDNIATLTVGYCDLLVDIIEETRSNDIRQLKVSVSNIGLGAVDSAMVHLYQDSINNNPISSQNIVNLDAGESTELTFLLDSNDLNSLVSEEARIYLFDVESEYIEMDYGNNISSVSVYPDYLLNLSCSNGGKVIGSGLYEDNSLAVIKAEPLPGYLFDGWYENDEIMVGIPSETVIRMSRNTNLVAHFKQTDLTLNDIVFSNTPKKGKKVTVRASAEGGAFPYSWNYSIYLNGKYMYSKFNGNDWFTFETESAGNYKVVVTCVDASGTRLSKTRCFTVDEVYKIHMGEALPIDPANVREWIIDDTHIVTVNDEGQAVGRRRGDTKVTALTKDGYEITCEVEVRLSFWQIVSIALGFGMFFLPFWI